MTSAVGEGNQKADTPKTLTMGLGNPKAKNCTDRLLECHCDKKEDVRMCGP